MEKVANIACEALLICDFSTVGQKIADQFFSLLNLKGDPTAREEGKIRFALMEAFFWLSENGILLFLGSWPGMPGLQ